jgi:hypothetical protein
MYMCSAPMPVDGGLIVICVVPAGRCGPWPRIAATVCVRPAHVKKTLPHPATPHRAASIYPGAELTAASPAFPCMAA